MESESNRLKNGCMVALLSIPLILMCSAGSIGIYGLLTIGRDDCEDNDIFAEIDTDGITILAVDPAMYNQVDFLKLYRLKTDETGDVSVQYDQHTGSQKVMVGQLSRTIPTGPTKTAMWSHKWQTLFFIIDDPEVTVNGKKKPERSSFCRWNPKGGFKALFPVSFSYLRFWQSKDQNFLTFIPESGKITEVTLPGGSAKTITCPIWAEKAVMLDREHFLLWRHDSGHYGEEFLWKVGPSDTGKKVSVEGDITDITCLNGEVWGLRHSTGDTTVVHLDSTLSKVTNEYPWPEIPDTKPL